MLQVLCALALGLLLGWAEPALAVRFKPLSDGFIFVIGLLVVPIVFVTVTSGLAGMGSLRRMGRTGFCALLYFEAMSALSLATGLCAGWLVQPGERLDAIGAGAPAAAAPTAGVALAHMLGASPVLQALLAALACALLLTAFGRRAAGVQRACQRAANGLFRLVRLVLKAAPLAAFGAIAYAAGRHGPGSIGALATLVAALYLASALFIVTAMGAIAWLCGFSLPRLLLALREELVLAATTSSSVAAMPGLMQKLEKAGCPRTLVAAVVPAGYSFNLNGSNIYLGMGLVFLAQLQHAPLSWGICANMLAMLMLMSKGASGVAGAAFMVLAASAAVLPAGSEAGLALLLGVERLLKCRVLANLTGNAVACLAIAAWSGQLDYRALVESGIGRRQVASI